MTAFLLDVNVLIALAWKGHPDRRVAQGWFASNNKAGWATCPFTEAAFVRIISNPAFSPEAVLPLEALSLLTANLAGCRPAFWGAIGGAPASHGCLSPRPGDAQEGKASHFGSQHG